jgi:hypothetical protein
MREKNAIAAFSPKKFPGYDYSAAGLSRKGVFPRFTGFPVAFVDFWKLVARGLFFPGGFFLTEVEFAHRVIFDQVGNLFVNRGVIVHLLFQRLVLGPDISEKSRGVTQKLGGKVGICGHYPALQKRIYL